MAPELSSIVSHLRSPRPLEVCSSLHEDWDRFMVPIDHSHGNNGSVFIVTAVGICSLQHTEKDKPATKPCTQEHLITFLVTNKHPSMEPNSFKSTEKGIRNPETQQRTDRAAMSFGW